MIVIQRVRAFLPFLCILAAFLLLLLICSGSWLIGRKIIALLILPSGAIWIVLLAMVCWPGVSKCRRICLAVIWILFSLAGSPYLGISLLRVLEKPYYPAENLNRDLDALVLLGGGTVESPGGNPAMGTHGDRLYRPAMWYHRGKVKTLITTGRSVTEKGEDRLLSKETSAIWQDLKIPESAIIEIPSPRNTAEELAAVADLLAKHSEWKAVGLCTSASHLNRALGEAEQHGLNLIPVPSDFRSMSLPFTPLYLVPQGRGFRDVQTALWEFLGTLL